MSPAYFSGTGCQATGNAVALSGTVSHAQLCIGENGSDTVVKEYFAPTGPGAVVAASVLLSALFDSTHFMHLAKIKITLKVWDTNGGNYDISVTAPAYNKGYVLTNHSPLYLSFFAPLRDSVSGSLARIQYDTSLTSSYHRASAITNHIPEATTFYIATHANDSGFVDCYGDGGLSSESVDYASLPGIISKKTVNQPPYNIAFVDGCHTAGHPGAVSRDGATAFGITGNSPDIDRAFVGWQNFVILVLDNDNWTERVWSSLASGQTLYAACVISSSKGAPIGCPGDTGRDFYKWAPIAPILVGDPVMKLHGVYGGDGIVGSLKHPDGSITTVYDSANQWFRPLP